MTTPQRQMHLGVFVLGTGNHSAGWRYDGAVQSGCSMKVMQSIASIAERGKFDLFFISDGSVMEVERPPSFVNRFEPMTLLSALSMVTKHIGLGATVSTSFNEPYNVARAFASLDHISGGRAGWNVVTSANNAAALNFSRERLNEHDLRYEIAGEFVDVVRGLWDCWDDGAIVADRATGTFLDASQGAARSITRGASSRSRGRSTSSARRKAIRSSSRPAARRPARSCPRARPIWCSRWSTAIRSRRRPPTTASSSGW